MTDISTRDREIAERIIKQAEAVCTIASSNFPSSTNVTFSSAGGVAAASFMVAHYEFGLILRLARAALEPPHA